MDVAFLGLGIMGSRMAANLIRAGHAVTVWNRSSEAALALGAAGARVAESPEAAVVGVSVVFTMLADPKAVAEVAGRFLPALAAGSLWVDCSTVGPEASLEMAALCTEKGVRFMDAPVAGSSGAAESGKLVFQVGASPEDLEAVAPLLAAMGMRTVHAGPVGSGSALKLVNNLFMAQMLSAWGESLSLAKELGLDTAMVQDAILPTPIAPAILGFKRSKLDQAQWSPEFPLKHALKDIRLALGKARQVGIDLPQAKACEGLYAAALDAGHGDHDVIAVCDVTGRSGS